MVENVALSFTATVVPEGFTVKTGGVDATVMVALVALTPSTVALTVAVPPLIAVIKPLLLTVRTFGLLLTQLVAPSVTLTLETWMKLAVTVACCVPEPTILVLVNPMLTAVGTMLVMMTDGPAAAAAATYTGVIAPFQIRNS